MRLITLSLCLALAACGMTEPNNPAAEKKEKAEELANARRLKKACGSQETYERLKALAFDEAVKVRRGESDALAKLSAASVIRMEDPVAKRRDEELNVTVCTGRLILELPPGSEDVFDGDRRLEADVEYAAQEAADGSGLVYQMQGADPIIYRLAAFDLPAGGPGLPQAAPTAVASAEVTEPMPAPPVAAPPVAPPPVPPAAARPPAPRPPEVARRPVPAPRPTQVARVAPPPPRPRPSPPTPRPAVEVAERPRATARPSFNCSYARSRVERMVCADPGLARADRAMSSEFYAALANADPETRRALRRSRDRFLGYRDRCGNAGCVAQAYSDRIDEIRDISSGEY